MTEPATPLPRRRFFGRLIAAWAGGAWLGRADRTARADQAEAAALVEQPYIGEIRMFAGDFAPLGWKFCDGQLLPILDYEGLYQVIGITYGGDGQVSFAVPDLRSRAPIHVGQGQGLTGRLLAESGGAEAVSLTLGQIPPHSHAAGASSANGSSDDPTGRVPARNAAGVPQYGASVDTNLSAGALLPAGGSSPHTNMQPYLGINYIICYEGALPDP